MAVVQFEFLSQILGEVTNVAIAIPMSKAGCELAAGGSKFKVIYLLHGGGDDCNVFLRNTSIERYSRQGNFAVIMPEVRNSYYCDMRYGLRFFAYLSEELPRVIENLFPISAKRQDRFVMGNSMGAQGAIKWALKKPEFFGAVAGLSGMGDLEDLGFGARFESRNPACAFIAAYKSLEDYRGSEEDIRHLAAGLVDSGKEIPRIFSCCGTEDFTFDGCVKFVEYARQIGLPVTFETGPGAHTFDFWDSWIRYVVRWFGLGEVS